MTDPVQSDTPAPTTHEHRLTTAACCIEARAASQERAPCRGSCSDLSEEHYHPSQERPPMIERLGWVIYEVGIDDLDLPDAEKLAAHILARLSGSVGE